MFEPTMDLAALVAEQTPSPLWGAFAAALVTPPSRPMPNNGRTSDQAHPPIHPTRFTADLDGQDKLIYEVRAKPFFSLPPFHPSTLPPFHPSTLSPFLPFFLLKLALYPS
jgi:hypothetical protein